LQLKLIEHKQIANGVIESMSSLAVDIMNQLEKDPAQIIEKSNEVLQNGEVVFEALDLMAHDIVKKLTSLQAKLELNGVEAVEKLTEIKAQNMEQAQNDMLDTMGEITEKNFRGTRSKHKRKRREWTKRPRHRYISNSSSRAKHFSILAGYNI